MPELLSILLVCVFGFAVYAFLDHDDFMEG
jgi:hypothetical protein